MNPTDEEIDALAEELMGNREFRAADMLLALKARVEAAEKRVKAAEYESKRYCQDVARWHERAEAAAKRVAELEVLVDRLAVVAGISDQELQRALALEAKP